MKHALITIGCTREYIDPVRYISNESSGRQGIALIKSLLKFNYKVICLHGYLQTKQIVSKNVKFIFTPTADEMLKEAKKYKSIDLGIFNAAVSDYKAKKYNKLKIIYITHQCIIMIIPKVQHLDPNEAISTKNIKIIIFLPQIFDL